MRGISKKQWTIVDKKTITAMIEGGVRTCEIVLILNVDCSEYEKDEGQHDSFVDGDSQVIQFSGGGVGSEKRTMPNTSEKKKMLGYC